MDLQELLDLPLLRLAGIALVPLKVHDEGRSRSSEDVVRAPRTSVLEAEAFGEREGFVEAHARRGTPCSFDQLRAPRQRGLLIPRGWYR